MIQNLTDLFTYSDFRSAAKRQLPSFVFDFIDGGAGTESTLKRNEQAFRNVFLTPKIGVDTSTLTLETSLFGCRYAAPFGIAPLGLCGLVHPKADIQLARIAAKFNLPYVASTTASNSVEDVAFAIGKAPWFQLYASKSDSTTERLLNRIEQIGCPVLIVTVDTASPGRRIRDLRHGLSLPFPIRLKHVLEIVTHPVWTVRRLSAGPVAFPNIDVTSEQSDCATFKELMSLQTGGVLDWDALRRLRQRWPRTLLLKGVQSAGDAKYAKSIGIDGVIVSNHGGRQLDCVRSPIELLPDFINEGLDSDFLFLDSGIRNGEDIVKSLVHGACFSFLGRPFLFALAAKGERGVERYIQLLIEELECTLHLMGACSPSELSQSRPIGKVMSH